MSCGRSSSSLMHLLSFPSSLWNWQRWSLLPAWLPVQCTRTSTILSVWIEFSIMKCIECPFKRHKYSEKMHEHKYKWKPHAFLSLNTRIPLWSLLHVASNYFTITRRWFRVKIWVKIVFLFKAANYIMRNENNIYASKLIWGLHITSKNWVKIRTTISLELEKKNCNHIRPQNVIKNLLVILFRHTIWKKTYFCVLTFFGQLEQSILFSLSFYIDPLPRWNKPWQQ